MTASVYSDRITARMLMIRLQRVGRKHEPVFRLVLTDSKNSTKSGKFLEVLGNFDARKGEKIDFQGEKIKDWVKKGAKLSDTVHNLLVEKKIITGKKINKLPKKKPILSGKLSEETATTKTTAPESNKTIEETSQAKEEVEVEPVVEKVAEESAS